MDIKLFGGLLGVWATRCCRCRSCNRYELLAVCPWPFLCRQWQVFQIVPDRVLLSVRARWCVFQSPYKFVYIGCYFLLFFKSLRKIRNPFFQFRLFGGVLVDQLQAHVFGDLTCDLFFERRAYEFIQFRNAPFRPFEFFFDVRFVFVSEPSCAIIVSRLAKITPNISIISPYILLLLLKRVAKAKYWERQSFWQYNAYY